MCSENLDYCSLAYGSAGEPIHKILNRGKSMGNFAKEEISQAELTQRMAGGAEFGALLHELAQAAGDSVG